MARKTRTLLFGLFVVAGRPLTAAQCVALAAPFGVGAANVKSHLTRLVAEGVLARRGRVREGRYAVSDTWRDVVNAVDARLAPPEEQPWSGDWILLSVVAPTDRGEREDFAARLWFDGFRATPGGAFVRPDWPRPWAAERARAFARGGGVHVGGRVFGLSDRDVDTLFEIEKLDRDAAALARRLEGLRRTKSHVAAFRNRMEAGGIMAQFIAHDPRLPREIWGPRTGMEALFRAWRAFEEAVYPLADEFVETALGGGHD